jgi:uncharacterized protein
MRRLRDQVIVVTGASSGIGREVARQLAGRGARLALCARRLELLETLSGELAGAGAAAPLVERCDVGDWSQVRALAARVGRELGPADVLVANAGRGAYGPFEQLEPEVAAQVVATNLLGVVFCVRAFLPAMLERGRGHLVLVSSVLGELPAPRHALYGATKFAVSGLAESLDYELAERGIRVTLVEPGLVPTEFGQVSGTPPERRAPVPSQSAARVAAKVVRAVERGSRKVITDRASQLAIACRRHFPRLSRPLFAAFIRRLYR